MTPSGAEQARCPHCAVSLGDWAGEHMGGCPWPAEQARKMQNRPTDWSQATAQGAKNAFPYRLTFDPGARFASSLISEIRAQINRIVEEPNPHARYDLICQMELGVRQMCRQQLAWYDGRFNAMIQESVNAARVQLPDPIILPSKKHRVCAFTGWKYKWILEYDPRRLGAWEFTLRRELKRHL